MDKVLVIKDEQGNFVNLMGLGIIDNEWYYSHSTGLTEGVRFYSNPERAESICNNFQAISDRYGFNKTFSLESVDVNDMPNGETICNKILPNVQERMGYFIKDSFNCFGGTLGLSIKNMDGTGLEWSYIASRNADRWHGNKDLALAEIQRLEELNVIAGIEGLTWELIYANRKEFPNVDDKLMIINKDIPFRCIGRHKKAEREIRKKYKTIFAEIERDFREKRKLQKKQLAVG